ncbi:MAG TPA: arylsulfatase, partial [Blastocatellia bacterium]|nr:arylsulfatase [Blastocatellia bacterium]
TGLHTGHALVRGNKLGGGVPLRLGDVTVADVLKKAGYATGAFGKWGLGLADTTGHPNKKGFDDWFGYLDQTLAHDYYPDHLWRNSARLPLDGKHYSHDLIVDEAFNFIRENKDRPFFLYLSITIPHASLEVPEDSLRKYRGKFPEKPFAGGGYAPQETPRAAFAAMIDRLDQHVGRMMSLLESLGIDNNTVVFFTSDNGPHREGGGDPAFFNSSGPLRGIKRDMYEGGIRVPMIVRWPGRVAAHSTNAYAWAFWDFLPTAAEIAGTGPPRNIDGISALATLVGKRQREHPCFYWEFYEGGFKQASRCGKWKAVRLGVGSRLELYDLDADPGEQHDVAALHRDVVNRMEKLLKSAHTESDLWPTVSVR